MSAREIDGAKAFLPLRCPKCGGELGKSLAGRFTCPDCGTSFLPSEVFAGKPADMRELYERAFAAAAEGAYGRALGDFNRILLVDSGDYEAWVGKAVAAAYDHLNETGLVKASEVLWCLEMAFARYGGEDRSAFQRRLADRVGALAVDLTRRVKSKPVYDEGTLRSLLDLLAYWEERGNGGSACWAATVAVA
ncbi:MAG: hypothetical protein PVH29_10690 [Candidatus Zixiibacteriota bacterium]|jgi:hypothetical protein